MQRPIEIQKQINRKGDSNSVGNLFYILMSKCNQPYSEILDMPIPMALGLIKSIELENKEMLKQQKKRNKKKW